MGEKVTLYWHIISQPSRSIKAILKMGNVDHEDKIIDIFKGEQKGEEFTKINPRQFVPFVIEGDFKLGESTAIAKYLCETRTSIPAGLWPADPKKRAKVDQHLEWYQNHFRPAMMGPLVYGIIPKIQGGEVDDASLQFVLANAKKQADMLESLLSNSNFLAGDELTLADIFVFHEVLDLTFNGSAFEKHPKIAAWIKRILETKEIAEINEEFKAAIGPMTAAVQGFATI